MKTLHDLVHVLIFIQFSSSVEFVLEEGVQFDVGFLLGLKKKYKVNQLAQN